MVYPHLSPHQVQILQSPTYGMNIFKDYSGSSRHKIILFSFLCHVPDLAYCIILHCNTENTHGWHS